MITVVRFFFINENTLFKDLTNLILKNPKKHIYFAAKIKS